MKTTLCLLSLLCVGSVGSLMAAQPETKPPTDFKSLDTDRDGRLSLKEFTAPAATRRSKEGAKAGSSGEKPAAGDGILSSANTIEGRYSPEVFRLLDVDHDKFVSPAELEALFSSAHNISQP